MKKQKQKTFTIESNPENIKARIKELEAELRPYTAKPDWHDTLDPNTDLYPRLKARNIIKAELNILYKLRYKQKNYTKPPTKVKTKGL